VVPDWPGTLQDQDRKFLTDRWRCCLSTPLASVGKPKMAGEAEDTMLTGWARHLQLQSAFSAENLAGETGRSQFAETGRAVETGNWNVERRDQQKLPPGTGSTLRHHSTAHTASLFQILPDKPHSPVISKGVSPSNDQT